MGKSRYFLLLLLLSSFITPINAQNEDFKAFRDRIHSDFSQFRRQVLSDYDKFLAGVWEEYETFRSELPGKKPKPKILPVCPDTPAGDPVELIPNADSEPDQLPVSPLAPAPGKVPNVAPPTFTPPAISPLDVTPTPSTKYVTFTFCGVEQRLPEAIIPDLKSISPEHVSSAWKTIAKADTKSLISSIQVYITAYGLNDWLTYLFVQAYVDALAPARNCSERVLMTQFIMSHLGYDVRLAKTDNQLVLLIPVSDKVYSRLFIPTDGIQYYIFFDDLAPIKENENIKILACKLPDKSTLGKSLSLIVSSPITIDSGETHHFNISYQGITITGSVDKNVMELFRHYPQTEIRVYASSVISSEIRKQLLSQLSPKLSGLTELEKVNLLLHFTQSAFSYATDQDQHGYEKFYFLEENLYYPKNDCEDRAIFFGYMVRHLVGLKSQLIGYPEHESCAVKFNTSISGDCYTFRDERFVISDPCYIGADVGQCMPAYKQTSPKVEYSY